MRNSVWICCSYMFNLSNELNWNNETWQSYATHHPWNWLIAVLDDCKWVNKDACSPVRPIDTQNAVFFLASEAGRDYRLTDIMFIIHCDILQPLLLFVWLAINSRELRACSTLYERRSAQIPVKPTTLNVNQFNFVFLLSQLNIRPNSPFKSPVSWMTFSLIDQWKTSVE